MKYFWQSMVVAFGMYSKIPVPKVVWQKENMRYAFCFLPLVADPRVNIPPEKLCLQKPQREA